MAGDRDEAEARDHTSHICFHPGSSAVVQKKLRSSLRQSKCLVPRVGIIAIVWFPLWILYRTVACKRCGPAIKGRPIIQLGCSSRGTRILNIKSPSPVPIDTIISVAIVLLISRSCILSLKLTIPAFPWIRIFHSFTTDHVTPRHLLYHAHPLHGYSATVPRSEIL